MKILSIDNIRKGDQFTISNEPIASIDLMERASQNCVKWILENYIQKQDFVIFVGPGNNGGDGIAIARLLKEKEHNVRVLIVEYTKSYSIDFQENLNKFKGEIKTVSNADNSFNIENNEIIIDAIFGSGLSREINGFVGIIIDYINSLDNQVISIDIPSGLMGDKLFDTKVPKIIHANNTLSIAFP